MPEVGLRPLYRAMSHGTAERFLDAHPDFVSDAVVHSLQIELRTAVEYHDLTSATLAASTAAVVLTRLGRPEQALALQLTLVGLQRDLAGTAEEVQSVRAAALALGYRAQDAGRHGQLVDCWLTATECAWTLADPRSPDHAAHLLTALRDLADLSELIAEQPPDPDENAQIGRFTALLADVSHAVYSAGWSEDSLLGLRALLRRTARAAERVVPRGITTQIYPDSSQAQAADRHLLRLFAEIDT